MPGLISTAAMLAAILLGATAGRGDPSAMEGAILAGQSAAIQHQINYTRSQEFEADRIGIGTMAAAGYDPLGMATMFEELNRNSPSPDRVKAVEFLIDHPLSAERVAEARNRAEQIGRIYHVDSLGYKLMRERLRSLVGNPQARARVLCECLEERRWPEHRGALWQGGRRHQCQESGRRDSRLAGTAARVSEGDAILRRAWARPTSPMAS